MYQYINGLAITLPTIIDKTRTIAIFRKRLNLCFSLTIKGKKAVVSDPKIEYCIVLIDRMELNTPKEALSTKKPNVNTVVLRYRVGTNLLMNIEVLLLTVLISDLNETLTNLRLYFVTSKYCPTIPAPINPILCSNGYIQ
ncbi:hypothetical protein RCZ01_06370 [Capnocytophaga felis]|uniref:Uncharacterized protein n=1 Tax=Capnocytophaga felis TaxID=2267611 RepID=A0A5M4B7S5_9FLAO|nr:hypothetical protein RCZ01_06370 [Capnocytophaga felis]GET47502.1 hypothetical protein RCZ02_03330 [Capnocytophaga felis]